MNSKKSMLKSVNPARLTDRFEVTEAGDPQAAKMILEVAGFYKPAATVSINHQVDAGPTLRELLNNKK